MLDPPTICLRKMVEFHINELFYYVSDNPLVLRSTGN